MKDSQKFIISRGPSPDCALRGRGVDNASPTILTDGVVKVSLFLGGKARGGLPNSDLGVAPSLLQKTRSSRTKHFE